MAKREQDYACGLNETGMRAFIADVEQGLRGGPGTPFKKDFVEQILSETQWMRSADEVKAYILMQCAPKQKAAGKYKKGR